MFAVAGVTGQTGAAVASELLERGQQVRVLVRSAEKGAAWRERGADVSVLSLDDVAALVSAFEGIDGAYLIVPPCYDSPDPNAAAFRVVDAYRAALEARPLARLVVLSSIGAQHPDKTGPIIPCHYLERELSKLTRTRCTFLRSAYFMENLPNFLPAIKGDGVLPVLFSPSRVTAMVSVRDIGRFSANTLMAASGPQPPSPPRMSSQAAAAEHDVVEISGPTDQSFNDVAALFSKALGTAVKAVQVPEANIVATLTGVGLPRPTAELYREMAMGVDSGRVAFERGPVRQVRGPTRIEDAIHGFVALG
jgi:uncharacterized protein YbjT (DUF2867 family)